MKEKNKKEKDNNWNVEEFKEKYGKLPIKSPDEIVKKILTKNPKEDSKKKD
jgi:hypothetical protein